MRLEYGKISHLLGYASTAKLETFSPRQKKGRQSHLGEVADILFSDGNVGNFEIFKDSIRAMNAADMAMHEAMDCAESVFRDVTTTTVIKKKGLFRKEQTATDTRRILSHAVIGEDAAPPPTLDTLSEEEQQFFISAAKALVLLKIADEKMSECVGNRMCGSTKIEINELRDALSRVHPHALEKIDALAAEQEAIVREQFANERRNSLPPDKKLDRSPPYS